MATRFYLPSSGAAAVTPAVSSSWTQDGRDGRSYRTDIVRQVTPMRTISSSAGVSGLNNLVLAQWVSDPLAAQSLDGNRSASIVIRGEQDVAANNLALAWTVYVVSGDGLTVRGTYVAYEVDDDEVNSTSMQSRIVGAITSAVSVQAGDRLVIEVGLSGDPDGGSGDDGRLRIGDASGNDLPANNSSTSDYNPWVHLPANIIFQAGGSSQAARSMYYAMRGMR